MPNFAIDKQLVLIRVGWESHELKLAGVRSSSHKTWNEMKKEKTTKQLLGAWVCDLANRLINDSETPMTQSEAFRRAHLARELVAALGQGIVVFEYVKKDGSPRLAQGTLCKGVSEKYDAYEYKTDSHDKDKYSELDIPYWDLDKEAFRNFSVARVVGIHGVVIPNYRENNGLNRLNGLIEFV